MVILARGLSVLYLFRIWVIVTTLKRFSSSLTHTLNCFPLPLLFMAQVSSLGYRGSFQIWISSLRVSQHFKKCSFSTHPAEERQHLELLEGWVVKRSVVRWVHDCYSFSMIVHLIDYYNSHQMFLIFDILHLAAGVEIRCASGSCIIKKGFLSRILFIQVIFLRIFIFGYVWDRLQVLNLFVGTQQNLCDFYWVMCS